MEDFKEDETFDTESVDMYYFHPVYTTFAFLLTLPYLIGLSYICWIGIQDDRYKLTAVSIIGFLLTSGPFLMIVNAFIRLLFSKPAIEFSSDHLVDHWNKIQLAWTEVKKVDTFTLRWSFLAINTTDNNIVFKQVKNPSTYIFMRLEHLLTRQTLKINISLVKGRNSNIVATAKHFWKERTATNIGFASAGGDPTQYQQQ